MRLGLTLCAFTESCNPESPLRRHLAPTPIDIQTEQLPSALADTIDTSTDLLDERKIKVVTEDHGMYYIFLGTTENFLQIIDGGKKNFSPRHGEVKAAIDVKILSTLFLENLSSLLQLKVVYKKTILSHLQDKDTEDQKGVANAVFFNKNGG
ncbi:hypothetical protein P7K49_016638 [Saguinus oedipus]|uniref:Uncharacterized protein n=1 Tax=Saguinus oedipus TaxID=9490 RepID=A0ABQ9VDZ8_SAGOE|nr:hypothetical protein P7K49_016638 [Saguinus oedipus]